MSVNCFLSKKVGRVNLLWEYKKLTLNWASVVSVEPWPV